MRGSFYQKSAFLILLNLITGILSFGFSVILTRKIGALGMGLLSLIMPINNLLLSVLSGGLLVAVSKVVSEYGAKGQLNNVYKCVRITLLFNFFFSLVFIGIIYALSYPVSLYVMKDLRVLYAFRFLLLSIIFMTLTNTYKGYFYGMSNVKIPGLIDAFEKFFRIILLLMIFKLFFSVNVQTNITIGYMVFFGGELLSFILFAVYYHLDKEIKRDNNAEDGIQLLYNVYSVSFPLMVTEFIVSSLYSLSALILPRRLVAAGISYSEALRLIGRFAGMSFQIVFFPMFILFSISAILIPDISGNLVKGNIYQVRKRIKQVMLISAVLGIMVFAACQIFPDMLGQIIFHERSLGSCLRFVSVSAPLLYLTQCSRSILNGLGKQRTILKYSLLTAFVQVILLYLLVGIPEINIYGFGITVIVTSVLSFILYVREIYNVLIKQYQ